MSKPDRHAIVSLSRPQRSIVNGSTSLYWPLCRAPVATLSSGTNLKFPFLHHKIGSDV
jgi:hypothetical protein